MAADNRWYPPPHPGAATHVGDAGGAARQVAENWQKGADGEAATARELTRLPAGYRVFHDLKVPGGGKGNIDHLVLGPSGAWLIDTKAWSGELTAGNGTLWRGRTPIRKEVEQVEWQAERAAERLGVDVNPMLCFVGTRLPRPAQMVGRARVVSLEALVGHIAGAPQVHLPQHVEGLDQWARTMQLSSPRQADRRPQRPAPSTAPTAIPPAGAPSPMQTQPASPPSRALTGCLSTIGAVVVMVVIGVIALVFLGLFLRSNNDDVDQADGATGPAPTQLTAPSTTVPDDLKFEVDCPVPGLGWSLMARANTFLGPSAMRATATINGIPAFLGELGPGQKAEPLKGLQPNQAVKVDVQEVDQAGQVVRQYQLDVVTPQQPC